MQLNDIISIILLPFPYISFSMVIITGIWLMKYRGDISPIVNRLMDSREFLDTISKHVITNTVVVEKNGLYFVRYRNYDDVSIDIN